MQVVKHADLGVLSVRKRMPHTKTGERCHLGTSFTRMCSLCARVRVLVFI